MAGVVPSREQNVVSDREWAWHSLRNARAMQQAVPDYLNLAAWDSEARLRIVVETPKGSGAKLRFDPIHHVFTYQRSLPTRLTYPYDFGFVPGTLADDGDPLDALVIHDASTWPGTVIPCRPIALLKIRDKKPDQPISRQNHRLIAVPAASEASAAVLSDLQRLELEGFFRVVGQQVKEVTVLGWADALETHNEITRAIENHAKKTGAG